LEKNCIFFTIDQPMDFHEGYRFAEFFQLKSKLITIYLEGF